MQFAWRLVAGEIGWVSMTGSNTAILFEVIATGAARGVLIALRFVHVIGRESRWFETAALYRASSPRLLQFLYRSTSLATHLPFPRNVTTSSKPHEYLRTPGRMRDAASEQKSPR